MMSPAASALFVKRAQGTQAIARAIHVLRLIARRGAEGSGLTDLSKATGIPHPTLRRILLCLIAERSVIQDAKTRRYRLGPLNYELGLATIDRSDVYEALKPVLERITRATGDTVYLNVRSGFDQVCVLRLDGFATIRAVTQQIGGRRPLSFGSSGLAIMAAMDDEEIERTLLANTHEIANHDRLTPDSVRTAITRTRHDGFAVVRDTFVPGVSSLAILLPSRPDDPSMAIAVAMVSDRLTFARARELYKILQCEVQNHISGIGGVAFSPPSRAIRK